MLSSAKTIEQSVHKTNDWLTELETTVGLQDKDEALMALRGVLHSLRDCLPVDMTASLAAQLPLVVRGIYYEDWDPSRTPEKIRNVDAFIERVNSDLGREELKGRSEDIIVGTLDLLNNHLNRDSIEKFRQAFPSELRELWPQKEATH